MSIDYSTLENQLDQIYTTKDADQYSVTAPRAVHIYSTSSSFTCGIDNFGVLNQNALTITCEFQSQKQRETGDVEFSNVFLAEMQKQEKDVCDMWKQINELPKKNVYIQSNRQQTKLIRANVFPESQIHASLEMLVKRKNLRIADNKHTELERTKQDRRTRSSTVLNTNRKMILQNNGNMVQRDHTIKRRIVSPKVSTSLLFENEESQTQNEEE